MQLRNSPTPDRARAGMSVARGVGSAGFNHRRYRRPSEEDAAWHVGCGSTKFANEIRQEGAANHLGSARRSPKQRPERVGRPEPLELHVDADTAGGHGEDLGQRRNDLAIALRHAGKIGNGQLGDRHPNSMLIHDVRFMVDHELPVAAQVNVDLDEVEPIFDGHADRAHRVFRGERARTSMADRSHSRRYVNRHES